MSDNIYRHMPTRALQRAYEKALKKAQSNVSYPALFRLDEQNAKRMADELDRREQEMEQPKSEAVWEETR